MIAASLIAVTGNRTPTVADTSDSAYQLPPIQGYLGAERSKRDTAIVMGAYSIDSGGALRVTHIETIDGIAVEAPSPTAGQRRIAVLPGPHVLGVTFSYGGCRACRAGTLSSVSREEIRVVTESSHAYEANFELRNVAHHHGNTQPEALTTDDGFRWAPVVEEITGTSRAWGVDAVGNPLPKELLRD